MKKDPLQKEYEKFMRSYHKALKDFTKIMRKEGKTMEQIAKVIGISKSTLSRKLKLQKLQKLR